CYDFLTYLIFLIGTYLYLILSQVPITVTTTIMDHISNYAMDNYGLRPSLMLALLMFSLVFCTTTMDKDFII
ncbi:hypothetical protein F5146DRAFT_1051581, partial [Armillaria mellea]